MGISKTTAKILSSERIATDVYSMWLGAPVVSLGSLPGQFISVYSKDKSRMLPRPISICELDKEHGKLRIVFRVAGEGTREFSECKAGDELDILGPLGNGFPLEPESMDRRALKSNDVAMLVAGGIGIPPMLELAKQLPCRKLIVLGYRNELFLNEELSSYGDVFISTEDGSKGSRGTVMDAIRENDLSCDVLYSCGPGPMLRALKNFAQSKGIPAWLSLEERMACGVGACLACVCDSVDIDSHSNVKNKRVCKDGPVFEAREVEI